MKQKLCAYFFTLVMLICFMSASVWAVAVDDFNNKNYAAYLAQLDEDLAEINGRRPQMISLCRAVIAVDKTEQDLKLVLDKLNNDKDLIIFTESFYKLVNEDFSAYNTVVTGRYVYANTIQPIISICQEHGYTLSHLYLVTKMGGYLDQVNALLSIAGERRDEIEREYIESNSRNLMLIRSLTSAIARKDGELQFTAREYMDLALKIDNGKMNFTAITNVDTLYRSDRIDLAKELLLMNAYYNEDNQKAYDTAIFHYTQRFGDRDTFLSNFDALKKKLAEKAQ